MAIYRPQCSPARAREIDVSAVEAGINLLGPVLLDVTVNGRPSRRPDFPTGNRLEWPDAAPHGVYPAPGDDGGSPSPCSTTTSGPAWSRPSAIPTWADDPRFATQADRLAHQDELDAHLAAWTARARPHDVMELLQAAACRPAPCRTPRTSTSATRRSPTAGVFFEMDHPVIGPARFEGNPMPFSRTAPDNWRSAPLLGEDNDYVFRDIARPLRRRVRRPRPTEGVDLMTAHERVRLDCRSTALASSSWPTTRRARCSASCSPRWAPTWSRSSRPKGRRSRRIGPFADGRRRRRPQPDVLVLQHEQAQRRRRPVDAPTAATGSTACSPAADVFVTTLARPSCERSASTSTTLRPRAPALVVVSITPVRARPARGPTTRQLRPRRPGRSAGPLNSCGYDDHAIPPIRPGGDQAYQIGGELRARCGLLLALIERAADRPRPARRRLHARVPARSSAELANPYWFYPRRVVQRQTCRHAQPAPTQPALFQCGDGRWVYFVSVLADSKPWKALVRVDRRRRHGGRPHRPGVRRPWPTARRNFPHIQEIVEVFFLLQTAERRLPRGPGPRPADRPLNAPEDLLARRAPRWRAGSSSTVDATTDVPPTVTYPGAPFRFSSFGRPIPAGLRSLGEHTAQLARRRPVIVGRPRRSDGRLPPSRPLRDRRHRHDRLLPALGPQRAHAGDAGVAGGARRCRAHAARRRRHRALRHRTSSIPTTSCTPSA